MRRESDQAFDTQALWSVRDVFDGFVGGPRNYFVFCVSDVRFADILK
jgi:hypothetical protein